MNVNYYNEFDKGAAAWLRELINAKLIPFGYVDERSITEVTASDVQGFTQCHFFAGIGGWSLALQLAGVPASTRLWTGSPPCQPFSTAGKQLGQFDERHLAPVFLNLVSKCKPPVLFGEQVAAAIGKSWMCDLQTHLEGEDYAVGFSVLPACSVGAPHKRDRLFFGATLGYCDNTVTQGFRGLKSVIHEKRWEDEKRHVISPDVATHFWSEWKTDKGADGKTRIIPPDYGSSDNGISARVGRLRDEDLQSHPQKNRVMRLRGYGNAIVPQVAAEFVKAFMEVKNAI